MNLKRKRKPDECSNHRGLGRDLTAEQIQALQVTVLPLKVLFGTKNIWTE